MNLKDKIGKVPVPGWAFALFMAVYAEVLVHLWVTEVFSFGRFTAVLTFSLGLGCALALVTSLWSDKGWGKWATTALVLVAVVLITVQFFVDDAYKTFMPLGTLLSGAGGVARDFGNIVTSVILDNLWRIALMLLPVILYALFACPAAVRGRIRVAALGLCLGLYLLGYGIVIMVGTDAARFTTAYNFDSAVRCFGVHVGMILDPLHSSDAMEEPAFTVVTPPTLPTEEAPQEESSPEETAPAVVYGDNVLPLDFGALAENAGNYNISAIHAYVDALQPSKQNEFTGLFKGKNLILITAEAFTAEVIDPELTPTLYRMANEGIRFTDYYQPAWGGSTTTGEFSNLFGLVPASAGSSMMETRQQKMFLTMGFQLDALGYYSVAYHNHNYDFYRRHETHTRLGYEKFLAQYGGLEGLTALWPESDLEMIDITVPQYIDNQPFNIYYMTVSGHCPYALNNNIISKKNYDVVADMDCSETLKGYYAANLELEYAMASLLRQLEESGIADDTVVALATDHYPYGLEVSSAWNNKEDYLCELYGVDSYDKFRRDKNALIIWSGCLEDRDLTVETPVYSLDILPTLSNLFGVEYDSRLLIGRDVFSEEIPLVLWPDYSWKTDRGTFDAATGIFTPAEGMEADEAYVNYVSGLVANKIAFSKSVQTHNYYNYVVKALEPETEK